MVNLVLDLLKPWLARAQLAALQFGVARKAPVKCNAFDCLTTNDEMFSSGIPGATPSCWHTSPDDSTVVDPNTRPPALGDTWRHGTRGLGFRALQQYLRYSLCATISGTVQ